MFQYYPFRSLFLLAAVTQDILEERCYSFTDKKENEKKKVISVQSCRDVKGIPDQTLPMVLLVVLTLLD